MVAKNLRGLVFGIVKFATIYFPTKYFSMFFYARVTSYKMNKILCVRMLLCHKSSCKTFFCNKKNPPKVIFLPIFLIFSRKTPHCVDHCKEVGGETSLRLASLDTVLTIVLCYVYNLPHFIVFLPHFWLK